MRWDLDRIRQALDRLGAPQSRLSAIIQVGGTNGKGSACAFLEAGLRSAGFRTGLYTSPHLSRFTERFRLCGVEADGEQLAGRWSAYREVISELTFFEQATILALGMFADEAVDVAVLEVGLGGRLDATNAIDVDVAVVTGVALDHVDQLGPDLGTIAREKAGIFKPGRVAVVGHSGLAEARPWLISAAKAVGAQVIEAAPDVPDGWAVGLAGDHQRKNAACALSALDGLEAATAATKRRVAVPEAARRAGLGNVFWPARLEEVSAVPRIWLDAAHNPQGAAALAAAMPQGTRVLAVAGVCRDKDARGILAPVVLRADRVFATSAPSPRALESDLLARLVQDLPGSSGRRVVDVPWPHAALAAAVAEARPRDLIVVFGSIFLCGAVRARLRGEPEDPVFAQDPVRL